MSLHGSDAPAWLFSFVDLAFLLLIAMTQVGGNPNALDLGEMEIPRIEPAATRELPAEAPRRWQLRIHPAGEGAPFELVRGQEASERLTADGLRQELAGLHARASRKPLLAPHADSRSQDLLDAAGLVEELWPGRRRATVAPIFARR
jgi:hypothetical protein